MDDKSEVKVMDDRGEVMMMDDRDEVMMMMMDDRGEVDDDDARSPSSYRLYMSKTTSLLSKI